MKFKKYIYEFVGFAIFYSLAFLLFGSTSTIICVISGIIGAYVGKFIHKVNGFFIDEIIDHDVIEESEGKLQMKFVLKADYKTKPVILSGSYIAIKRLETRILSTLLYNKMDDLHFKQVQDQGVSKIKINTRKEPIEIIIRQ